MATIEMTSGTPSSARPDADTQPLGVPGRRTGQRGLGYLPGLDGIRAIAVLAVLLYHADVAWMPGGFLGVDMFFVLSGFLITSILLSELERSDKVDFGRFYLHRARRLLPALFLVLAFSAVLAALFATDAAATLRRDIVGALTYVTNWVYVVSDQSYFEMTGRPPMLQHLWSLAVEEQFYLIWPAIVLVLFRLGGRTRIREWALIGALVSTLLMVVLSFFGGYPEPNDGSRVYFGTDTHAMGLLLGAALATVWVPARLRGASGGLGARRLVDVAGFGALAVAVLIMMTSHSNAAWLYWGGFAVFAAIVAVVVAAASHPSSTLGRVLGRQPWRYLGQRSYGLYLWHWPVFVVLRPGLDVPWDGFANFVLRLGLTFGLAELSYRYVEMPIRRGALKRQWTHLRTLSPEQRAPLLKKGAVAAAVTTLVAGGIGLRLVSIPEETPDYLNGLTSLSALDTGDGAGKHGKHHDDATTVSSDPTVSDTVTTPGTTTLKPGTLAIGESVMLGAQSGLHDTFKKLSIDAAVGRQASDVLQRIKALRDAGALRQTIILHTGTNGYIDRDVLKQILEVLSVAPRIVVVNVDVPREWEGPNNDLLAELVAQTPNAVLADWHARASSETGVHVSDGVHLTTEGIAAYSETIKQALDALTAAQASASPSPTEPADGDPVQ